MVDDESNNVISSSSSSAILIPKTEVTSDKEEEEDDEVEVKPQVGVLTLELPSDTGGRSKPLNGESLASTSGSQLKSYFVGMGFSPTLVDKVLQENGEDNVDLLLETLFTYSAIQKMSPEPSNSLDGSFSLCDNGSDSSDFSTGDAEMKDQDGVSEVIVDKRAALLVMNFSEQEVDFAIDELGERAPVNELVDFIIAAQIAESSRKDQVKSKYRLARIDMDNSNSKRLHFFPGSSTLERRTATDTDSAYTRNRNLAMTIKSGSVKLKALAACPQETTTETLFGTMDRTLRLLEMGFSENEISSAMDKYGLEISTGELADSIFAKRIGDTCSEKDKEISDNWTYPTENHPKRSYETLDNEASCSNPNLDSKAMDFNDILKGKRPKHEYEDHGAFLGPSRSEPKVVQPKATSYSMPSSSLPSWKQEMAEESVDDLKMPELPNVGPSRRIHGSVAKPPYFFYGNVLDVSYETWDKVSQFLYAIAPELVNTQFFSALIRKEGYVHNLPTDNRSPILPRPSMTIEGALPHTKPWWPSWDTRKQLSSICSDTRGSFQICDRLGKILANSKGMISKEEQAEILHSCKTLNLVWVDEYKLKPIEPEQIETILGYPRNHTQILIFDPMERLRSLKHSFQIDTLGYHLSGLKPIFPNGLTMLSLYSGIGGAEVALYRLGIRLKCVVSVEASEMNRKILKRWWGNTGQTGELVQLEDINRLTSNKLKTLAKDFGDFDFIICQNPCDISSTTSKSPLANETGLDFTMFYEFVRVLQRLRSTIR